LRTDLGHATIDDKVSPVHEAAFVTSEEEYRLCLLDSFPKAAAREVNFAAVPLSQIVTQPVLEERGTMRAPQSMKISSQNGMEDMTEKPSYEMLTLVELGTTH
jgi:hypothetical protein